jgi:hypothetical protein
MQAVVSSLMALKPNCAFTGSSKIFESLYLQDDLFNTLGRSYGYYGPSEIGFHGTSYIETIKTMRAKCPSANLASSVVSTTWCTDDYVVEIGNELLQTYGESSIMSYFHVDHICGWRGCSPECVAAEKYFAKSLSVMFASGSVLSTTPKPTCELKGTFQKSSPAALIGAGEEYLWNLSLTLGRPHSSRTEDLLVLPSIRDKLDSFQCPFRGDGPTPVIPECNKRDFENLDYIPYQPTERSTYHNVTAAGEIAVKKAMEVYKVQCAVS